ncbi:MAG: prephenate dehydrogenase/arogenate dehydrogenase family protein [Chloroflexi bacterium]|nr:prephenate dehydrogenase/arogenate dehydrogenase family protein [Chloroflexota bacterium]
MKTQTISIIGLNRIGVSIGLALKNSPLDFTIVGHDKDSAIGRDAKEVVGAIDKTEWNLLTAATQADILVLTLPTSELKVTLEAFGDNLQPHTLIVDLSGMKQSALNWAEQYVRKGHYIGAVPIFAADSMADGRSAIETADADLFRNSVFCLMPSPKADKDAVETAVNFGILLGATPYFLNPEEYDNLSHGVDTMPGLLSAAMFSAIYKSEGWRDMLRFAGLNFSVSTAPLQSTADNIEIAMQDKNALLRWIDAVMDDLTQMRRWVHDGEAEIMSAYIQELNDERERWVRQRMKNEWTEVQNQHIQSPSFAEQMLGGFAPGRDKDDE